MINDQIIKSLISPFESTFLKDYRDLYQDKRFVSINSIEDYIVKSGTYRTIQLIRCEYNDGQHIVHFDLKKMPGENGFYVQNKTFIHKIPTQYFEYAMLEDSFNLFQKAILISKKKRPYSSNPNNPSIVEATAKGYLFTFYLRKKPYSIEEEVLSQFAIIDKNNPFNTYIDNKSLALLEMYCIN